MSDDEFEPLAETVAGIVLYITGVVSLVFGHGFTASLCFGSVAMLTAVRSWARTKEIEVLGEYYSNGES